MKKILRILTYLSAIMDAQQFIRPMDSSIKILSWFPKLFAGALSSIFGIIGAIGALLGLTQRDWKLSEAGILGAGFGG